jgi:transcriptional/translational regulatory protein YebC/TACO1
MNNPTKNTYKTARERLEEVKKDFIKMIPQLEDVQEVQRIYREVQEKKFYEQTPFINTQTSSTI